MLSGGEHRTAHTEPVRLLRSAAAVLFKALTGQMEKERREVFAGRSCRVNSFSS